MRWFWVYHRHIGDFSIFKTAEYGLDAGYDTEPEAVEACTRFILREQRELSSRVLSKSNELAVITQQLEAFSRNLEKITNNARKT